MRSGGVVVGDVLTQHLAEMPFPEHEDVVEALAADGPDGPLHDGVGLRGSGRE